MHILDMLRRNGARLLAAAAVGLGPGALPARAADFGDPTPPQPGWNKRAADSAAPDAAGALSDPGLGARLGQSEVDHLDTSRSLLGTNRTPEEVFAERCRAVALVLAGDGSGTGSVIDGRGYVLTALHVVAGAGKVVVGLFPDCKPGTQPVGHEATVVRIDELTDLALLQIKAPPANLVTMPLGDLGKARTGAPVLIIGHPRGYLMSLSRGLVSAVRPDYKWRTGAQSQEYQATVVQTDGALNPGNSGGPMMSAEGELLGVNSFIYGQQSAGLNFAVAVTEVRSFLARSDSRTVARPKPAEQTQQAQQARRSCNARLVSIGREENAEVVYKALQCAGQANFKVVAPDDTRQPIVSLWDRNGDGNADVRFYDADRDGYPETSQWDDDFDGKFEAVGEHQGQSWEPVRKRRS